VSLPQGLPERLLRLAGSCAERTCPG
jgi:hypothetical protein